MGQRMGTTTVRGPEQRRRESLDRLDREADIWVATADRAGAACLVPLSFLWDGELMWLSTRLTNPTGRNLRELGRARLSLADTHDVVLLDGTVRTLSLAQAPRPRRTPSPRSRAGTRAGRRTAPPTRTSRCAPPTSRRGAECRSTRTGT
ncbi:pyridoxamine 5'-phosphate oxidase family protein [Streptomyces sp. M19]